MVLIDKARGVLTQSSEFIENAQTEYIVQSEAPQARLADVFRVHDYNYLMKVLQLSNKLSSADFNLPTRFGK